MSMVYYQLKLKKKKLVSNLNEQEVEKMLSDAEKYASVDQEKKQGIDLKNQAERLCFEAEKELGLFKSNISEDKEQTVRSLIEKVKTTAAGDDITALSTAIENLKSEMKDMVTAPDPLVTDSNESNPMSDLNDL